MSLPLALASLIKVEKLMTTDYVVVHIHPPQTKMLHYLSNKIFHSEHQ